MSATPVLQETFTFSKDSQKTLEETTGAEATIINDTEDESQAEDEESFSTIKESEQVIIRGSTSITSPTADAEIIETTESTQKPQAANKLTRSRNQKSQGATSPHSVTDQIGTSTNTSRVPSLSLEIEKKDGEQSDDEKSEDSELPTPALTQPTVKATKSERATKTTIEPRSRKRNIQEVHAHIPTPPNKRVSRGPDKEAVTNSRGTSPAYGLKINPRNRKPSAALLQTYPQQTRTPRAKSAAKSTPASPTMKPVKNTTTRKSLAPESPASDPTNVKSSRKRNARIADFETLDLVAPKESKSLSPKSEEEDDDDHRFGQQGIKADDELVTKNPRHASSRGRRA
jgi:hypothetical protein